MKKILTYLFTLLISIGAMTAQTYTTLAAGAFNDPAVWSTDGGATPCNCIPVTETPTLLMANLGSMEIHHQLTLNKDLVILSSGLIVNVYPGASLNGPVLLEVRGGVLNNYGAVTVSDLSVFNSGYFHSEGVLTVNPGNLTNAFQGRIDLGGQVFVPNGNLPNEGWLNILQNAQISVGGSITNLAYVNIEPGACINVFGDFTNQLEVNLVNGPGTAYVESGGNITNWGIWDEDVNWCAANMGTGLPHVANCANCSLLPVELTQFDAWLDSPVAILRWSTSFELNNRYFTIERSGDGKSYEVIAQMGSQSPEEGAVYQNFDPDPLFGISWYRLSQTDQNGATQRLKTVMINNQAIPDRHFNVFPDPFQDRIRVTAYGLEGAPVDIRLTDLTGREVLRLHISKTTDHAVYELTPGDLPPGVYVVMISGKRVNESFKVLHR